jgi:DNA repair exonuclease SbcCD nuclease subunit
VALGHIHKPEVFKKFTGAYAGSPEPLDFGEYGEHGYMDVCLRNGQAEIEFIPESSRKFIAFHIEASTTDTVLTLATKIRSHVIDMQPNKDFFKITIKGYWDGKFEEASNQLKALLQSEFYDLTIRDQTKPDLNIERLEQIYGDSAIGRYIRTIQSSNLDEMVQKEALYIGLEALLKGKK